MLSHIDNLEEKAKQILPKQIYDHIAGGAGFESTIKANREAIDSVKLIPRELKNVEHVDMSTQILNINSQSPILIAPTAFHGLVNKDKELATAKAAEETNTIMIVSTCSNSSLETIAKNTSATLWFQLYPFKQKEITENLVKRAELAGYKAIVLTVDVPYKGNRRRDIMNNFEMPTDCKCENVSEEDLKKIFKQKNDTNTLDNTTMEFSASLDWDDISWLRKKTTLPILIKGILHPQDAELALRYGINGIIVSNHGGRQLDGMIGTLDALPNIVEVINQRIPILIDGGFRSGTDILKALALGANGVLIGRPILWGLAINGKEGVKTVLKNLQDDLRLAMQLTGCLSINYVSQQGNTIIDCPKMREQKLTEKLNKIEKQLNLLIEMQNKNKHKKLVNTNPYSNRWSLSK